MVTSRPCNGDINKTWKPYSLSFASGVFTHLLQLCVIVMAAVTGYLSILLTPWLVFILAAVAFLSL